MDNRVLVFEPDLMFSSRIESVSQKSGWSVDVKTTLDLLLEALKTSTPNLILVNLDAFGSNFKSLAGLIRGPCRLVGYYSHVASGIAREARANGFQSVIPRRTFMVEMSELFKGTGLS